MFVSEDLHQKRDVEFIEARKCDTKPHIRHAKTLIYILLSQFTIL